MINLIGTSPFLRIAVRVAIVTMHFQIAQISLFLWSNFVPIQCVPTNDLALMRSAPRLIVKYCISLTRQTWFRSPESGFRNLVLHCQRAVAVIQMGRHAKLSFHN